MTFFNWMDERFVAYRLQSTRVAAMAAICVAMGLFLWHVWFDHVWNWELLSVGLTMAGVKLAMMAWYYLTT